MRVKICGITRPEDGAAAAVAGADAIGLVFYPKSSRAISTESAQSIVASLPPFVTVVGLFVDPDPNDVARILSRVPIDALQFHGDESAAFCEQFQRPWMKALRASPMDTLVGRMAAYVQARSILVDSVVSGQFGGSGHPFDWRSLPDNLPTQLVLAGGLDPVNVREAVMTVRPSAVDVSSGVESSPGMKDPQKMRRFVANVRAAAEEL